MSQGSAYGIPIDTDGTLAANSDQLVPSQKAVKTYVDTATATVAPISIASEETADFTLDISHIWNLIPCNDTENIFVTIPTNASVAFPVGTMIWIYQKGSAAVVIQGDVGVTVSSPDDYLGTRTQYSQVRLTKIDTDVWLVGEDVGTGYDPDFVAFWDEVIADGGSLTETEQQATNQLVLDLKNAGLWASSFYYIYPFVGGSAAAHKFNLVDPTNINGWELTFSGSPIHNSNGVTFNGTTQYADTGLDPSTDMSQDSKHYSFYLRTNGTGFVGAVMEGGGSFRGDRLSGNFAGTLYHSLSKVSDTVAPPGTMTGEWLINRTDSTTAYVARNDSTVDSDGAATSYNPAGNFYLAARNLIGSGPASYNACNMAFASSGVGLTSGQATNLYNAIVTFETTLGRNV